MISPKTRVKITSRFIPQSATGKWIVPILPYGWVSVFLVIPFFIILYISFSESQTAIPPYIGLYQWAKDMKLTIVLNVGNYISLFQNDFYVLSFLKSLKIATISTFCCLLIAYPMAFFIARAPKEKQIFLILLIVLPFWTSFLIRVYAWVGLLNTSGIINSLLMWLGVINSPLPLINNDFAVCIGIIYSYLPFMILPLYTAIEKIDPRVLEAAHDLGCRPFKTFWKVTLPLSWTGVVAGSMLVLIPASGEVVIPILLGGVDNLMVGKVLWQEFFNNGDWPVACALAITLLAVLMLPLVLLQRMGQKAETGE